MNIIKNNFQLDKKKKLNYWKISMKNLWKKKKN